MRQSADPANTHQALLKALPPIVRALAVKGVVRRYRTRTMLITENDEGDSLYVVLSGLLRIFCADARGREVTLAIYGRGEYVGEMSLDGEARSASVVTETETVCAVVSGDTLRKHLAENAEFTYELILRLIRRVRLTTDSARSMALLDAYGRLTHLLDRLAVSASDGTRSIMQKLTHRDISQRIGCSRELVSRILKDLETGGYIAIRNRQYDLLRKLPSKW